MLALSIRFGVQVLVILGGIMPLVWEYTGSLKYIDSSSEFQRGLIFVIYQALRFKAFDVPIVLYDQLIIKPRHGVDGTTMAQIFYDQLIQCSLMLAYLPPLLYGYLWVTDHSGPLLYWAVGIFACIIAICTSVLYPIYLHPLIFNTRQLDNGQLKQKMTLLLKKHNFSANDICIIDQGSQCFAYITGFGGHYKIMIQQNAIDKLQNQQILAVLAHQLCHWKNCHTMIKLIVFGVKLLAMFYLFSVIRDYQAIFRGFGFKDKSTFVGSALFFHIFQPVTSTFQMIQLLVSRYLQFSADSFAISQGLSKQLGSALIKLNPKGLLTIIPDNFYTVMKHAYPSVHQRLNQIRKSAGSQLQLSALSNSNCTIKSDKHSSIHAFRTSRTQYQLIRSRNAVFQFSDRSLPIRINQMKIKRV